MNYFRRKDIYMRINGKKGNINYVDTRSFFDRRAKNMIVKTPI